MTKIRLIDSIHYCGFYYLVSITQYIFYYYKWQLSWIYYLDISLDAQARIVVYCHHMSLCVNQMANLNEHFAFLFRGMRTPITKVRFDLVSFVVGIGIICLNYMYANIHIFCCFLRRGCSVYFSYINEYKN